MNASPPTQIVPAERIERLIYLVRGEKVMLDADLAMLYGVATGALNRAVKRNAGRFPGDFMFELTVEEAEILKCQTGISSSGHGGRRRSRPHAFTEQGVAMLSSVLKSERAVHSLSALIGDSRRLGSVGRNSPSRRPSGPSEWARASHWVRGRCRWGSAVNTHLSTINPKHLRPNDPIPVGKWIERFGNGCRTAGFWKVSEQAHMLKLIHFSTYGQD